MALSPKLQREVDADLYRGLAERFVKMGLREFQVVADLLKDPEHVDPETLERCIVVFYKPRRPYFKTSFGLTSRS